MPKLIDITGQSFGRWIVLFRSGTKIYPSGARQPQYLCRCSCGTEKLIVASILRDGSSKSCGCFNKEVRSMVCIKRNTTHGHAGSGKSATYKIWSGMLSRCHNPKASCFPKYGAKGIFVCERWRESFINFLADMGQRPSTEYSIERINPFMGYFPENCEWILTKEQQNNKTNSSIATVSDIQRLLKNFAAAKNLTVPELLDLIHPNKQ